MSDEQIGAVLALLVSTASSIAYARSHRRSTATHLDRPEQEGALPGFRHVHSFVQWTTPAAAAALLLGLRGPALAMGVTPVMLIGGAVLTVLGFTVFVLAKRALGRHYAPCYDARLPDSIVRNGPYAWIRHPIYTANLLALLGLTLATGSGWLLLNTVLVGASYMISAQREEQALRAARPDYSEYARQTGRFLPRRLLRCGATQ